MEVWNSWWVFQDPCLISSFLPLNCSSWNSFRYPIFYNLFLKTPKLFFFIVSFKQPKWCRCNPSFLFLGSLVPNCFFWISSFLFLFLFVFFKYHLFFSFFSFQVSCLISQITYKLYLIKDGEAPQLLFQGTATSFSNPVSVGIYSWYVEAADTAGSTTVSSGIFSFSTQSAQCENRPPVPPTVFPVSFKEDPAVPLNLLARFSWKVPDFGLICSSKKRSSGSREITLFIFDLDSLDLELNQTLVRFFSRFPCFFICFHIGLPSIFWWFGPSIELLCYLLHLFSARRKLFLEPESYQRSRPFCLNWSPRVPGLWHGSHFQLFGILFSPKQFNRSRWVHLGDFLVL